MIPKKQILLAFLVANIFIAQSQIPELTKKDSTIVSSWIFGIGFNIVDDSDDQINEVIDIKSAWNAVPYPSRLSIGKYFKNGIGLEAIASYNRYKEGKIVDGLPNPSTKDYAAIDTRLSYDLNKLIGHTGWFDPYVGVGIGYTHANDVSRGTYNGVLGFRTWFSDRIGLDVNSSGKWTIDKDLTNHLQHAIGVVYRFKSEKDLTKKGREKLEIIEAFNNETKRVNDSIALAKTLAEEKRVLAEKIAKENEIVRLAQMKEQAEQARNKEENDIQKKIDTLEDVYFAFDSTVLTKSSKEILSQLVLILNEYPNLEIEINSHTDSRGPSEYNQQLSELRLKATIKFLIDSGIASQRLIGQAYGETKLVNECNDETICSEAKHKKNRRSEFKIVKY
jgi:outer membrane protein OmpA-like peptidoglycan-associated protein